MNEQYRNAYHASMTDPDLLKRTVKGEALAAAVASSLAFASIWFIVQPLPDGYWQFKFKDEPGNEALVDARISVLSAVGRGGN